MGQPLGNSLRVCKRYRWGHLLAGASTAKMTARNLDCCAEAWIPAFIRDILVRKWKTVIFHWIRSYRWCDFICKVHKILLLLTPLIPRGPQVGKESGKLLSSSSTLVKGKGLMTGEATSSYKWHVLEGPHLTLSSKKAASVAVLSLRAAAFMTQGTMSNWYMSPEGHGLRLWWSFYFQDSPMSGEWIPPWWCTAQSRGKAVSSMRAHG